MNRSLCTRSRARAHRGSKARFSFVYHGEQQSSTESTFKKKTRRERNAKKGRGIYDHVLKERRGKESLLLSFLFSHFESVCRWLFSQSSEELWLMRSVFENIYTSPEAGGMWEDQKRARAQLRSQVKVWRSKVRQVTLDWIYGVSFQKPHPYMSVPIRWRLTGCPVFSGSSRTHFL